METRVSAQQGRLPLKWLHDSKFWVNVARVDNAYGDRNLLPTLCACEI